MKELNIYVNTATEKQVGQDGSLKKVQKAIFKFWSDEQTSDVIQMRFPKHVRKYKADNRAIIVELPYDYAVKFIGGKFWGELISEYEKNGFYLKLKDEDVLRKLEFAANQEVGAEEQKKVITDLNDYIDSIIMGLEKDFNDPRFQELLNNIKVFTYNPSGNGDYFGLVRPSVGNVILMLRQWRAAGKQGYPTFVTTRNMWEMYFGMDVNSDAVRLLVNEPSNVTGQTKTDAMRQLGVSSDDIKKNIGAKFAVDKFRADKNYGNIGQNNFGGQYHMIVYYDKSDVSPLSYATPEQLALFDKLVNVGDPDNNDGAVVNEPQHDDVPDNMTDNEKKVYAGIVRYANESGDAEISGMIKAKKGLYEILRAMVQQNPNIDRNKNASEKERIINTIMFCICYKYKILNGDIGTLYANSTKFITKSGKPNNADAKRLLPYAYDIMGKIGPVSIKEDASLVELSEMLFENNGEIYEVYHKFNNILNRISLKD